MDSVNPRFASALAKTFRRALLHRWFLLVCLACAVGIRMAWLAWSDAQPTSDFEWYYQHGLRLADGKGYSVDHDGFPLWAVGRPLPAPRPTAFWPVGYPAFLAGVFTLTRGIVSPLLAAQLANIGLSVLTVGAVAYAATLIFGSGLAGRLTLLLAAFVPNHIAYTSLTSVEIYFAALIAAGVALLLHSSEKSSWPALIGAGLVFGFATLTKPQAVILPALLLGVLMLKQPRRLAKAGLLIYLPLALVPLVWTLRNFNAFERVFFVSTNGWINLLIGNLPGGWNSGVMWNPELHAIITQYRSELEWNDAARAVVLEYAKNNPFEILAGLPKKLFWLYAADVDGFGWNRAADSTNASSTLWVPLRAVAQMYYVACLVGALLGSVSRLCPRTRYFAVGPVLALYFTLVYLAFFGGARFHFPVVPWFATYAAGFLAVLIERRAEPQSIRQVPSELAP